MRQPPEKLDRRGGLILALRAAVSGLVLHGYWEFEAAAEARAQARTPGRKRKEPDGTLAGMPILGERAHS